MPRRPQHSLPGGALLSTLRDGTYNGAQVLKPETVALMRQNSIGDLNVTTLKTVQPDLSNDANLFPGMPQKWGLSLNINTQQGPAGRSAGSIA